MSKAKPFCITKRDVWEAYKQVKANQGAAGVDEQSIADFDRDLSRNLYRIWNRMSSGSYFPPPVRRVDIPKGEAGSTRPLGIPTVSDRIAQMVVKRCLEPILEPVFHMDSYGYRPRKSAHDALAVARRRCWSHDWVQRWLEAPVSMPDGSLVKRTRGTPQGAVVSPLLANLFLHYAFDLWMSRNYPGIQVEQNPFAVGMAAHGLHQKAPIDFVEEALDVEVEPENGCGILCAGGGFIGAAILSW